MYSIKDNIVSEYEIKKSRFITSLYQIDSKNQVNDILKEVKLLFKGATHYCYAYIVNDIYHFSDDGEPGGTAGLPILEALKKNNITNVLCVVVRYFGGIKLGAGGLVRAYTKSVSIAINEANLLELVDGYHLKLETTYENHKNLEKILNKVKILKKDFSEKIIYHIEVNKKQLELFSNYKIEIIEEIKLKKEN